MQPAVKLDDAIGSALGADLAASTRRNNHVNNTLTRTAAFGIIALWLRLVAAEEPTSWGSLSRPSPLDPPSFTTRVTSAFKSGTAKVTGAIAGNRTKKPPSADNATTSRSIFEKPQKPSSQLYVSLAQLQETAGNFDRAQQQYQKALDQDPNDLAALLGYARLRDRQGDLTGATTYYQRAVAAHPNHPAPHNDLGLCYHRRRMLPQAAAELSKAVALQPRRPLYRNNLAEVLVAQGKPDEAFQHLTTIHPLAVAHYNLGCMLARVGAGQQALAHFQEALAVDPKLTAANDWIAQLEAVGVEAARPSVPAAHPIANATPSGVHGQRPANLVQHAPARIEPPQRQIETAQSPVPPVRERVQPAPAMAPPVGSQIAMAPALQGMQTKASEVATPRYPGPVTVQVPVEPETRGYVENRHARPQSVAQQAQPEPDPQPARSYRIQYASHAVSADTQATPIAPMPEDLE